MAFWSTEKLKDEQTRRRTWPLIEPYAEARHKHGAYELGVHRSYAISRDESHSDFAQDGRPIEIPAGHFAILMTDETLYVPPDAIAFISIKASYKLEGLVNVSGFHVDPGFHGRLKFSVYNAGSQILYLDPGKPLFLIWFADLDRETTDSYNSDGAHWDQQEINSKDLNRIRGIVPSPAGLNKRIDEVKELLEQKHREQELELNTLKSRTKFQWWLIAFLFATIVGGAVTWGVKNLLEWLVK